MLDVGRWTLDVRLQTRADFPYSIFHFPRVFHSTLNPHQFKKTMKKQLTTTNLKLTTAIKFFDFRFSIFDSLLMMTLAATLVAGCTSPKPLKPGVARIQSNLATNGTREFIADLKQPENPAQSASQNFERITETELPIPAQSKVQEVITIPPPPNQPDAQPTKQEKTVVLSAPTVQKTRIIEKAGTTIGAAQKDTAREVGAKLASLKGVVWVGVGLFLFGLATLFYPPLRAIIGSVTTSIAMTAGGVALMVLPSLIVGNELLILGVVALAVGGWFFAHRHGQLRGFVNMQNNVPVQNNGVSTVEATVSRLMGK